MPAFSLYVDEETYQKLQELGKKYKMNVQETIRFIIKEYFKEKKENKNVPKELL
jgi:Mor family transcriptional regulator